MHQYIIIVLIAFHLMSNSAYATNTLLEKDHIHGYTDKCATHQHSHSHNGSNHQHKHSHSPSSINFVDFFTYTQNINLFDFSNPKQTYLETVFWIPDPTLKSLFRPPKI